MRGDFDWQASSKGRKYLSASMKFAFGGATVPSLGQRRRVVYFSKHIITANYPSFFFTFKARWCSEAYKQCKILLCTLSLQSLIFFKVTHEKCNVVLVLHLTREQLNDKTKPF